MGCARCGSRSGWRRENDASEFGEPSGFQRRVRHLSNPDGEVEPFINEIDVAV